MAIHTCAAALTKTPELEIDENEAQKIADSIKKVSKYYPMAFDPKKVAIAELVCNLGTVYGPRIIALTINHAKKGTTDAPATPRPAPRVVDIQAAPKPNGKFHEQSPSQAFGYEPARDHTIE